MNNINEAENIHKELLDLEKNSRTVRTAHLISAQGKEMKYKLLGVLIILINIIIFSPLINIVFPNNPDIVAITIKILSITSASLASIQTLFNWQKEVELHLSAGEMYSNVYHKSGSLLAKFKDKIISPDQLVKEFDSLQDKYLEANNTYKSCIPTGRDYKKARIEISKRPKNV